MKKTILCMLFMMSCVCGFAQSAFYADDKNAGPTLKYNFEGKVTPVRSVEQFYEYVNTSESTMVFFYASWCGPCKMMVPTYVGFAQNHPELLILQVILDENNEWEFSEVLSKYGIMSMPVFLGLKGSLVYWRHDGVCSKYILEEGANVIKR